MKQAVTKADADALGSIKVDDYTTSKLSVSENQDIPGHGHSHGHGHGHGEGNAGGGVGELINRSLVVIYLKLKRK